MSQTSWTEEEWAEFQARLKTPPEGANPAPSITHGRDCPKVPHTKTGYLHDENDDSPYDVDGCSYCGRCHMSIDKPTERLEAPIQSECCKILEQDGWWILRTDPVSDRRRGTGFGAIGFADITAFRPMRAVQLVPLYRSLNGVPCEVLFLEFKSSKGKPSKAQLEWHRNQRAMGFATFIAGQDFGASTESFVKWYRASGLQRRGDL